MQNKLFKPIHFESSRLIIQSWEMLFTESEIGVELGNKIISILTPKVTQSLPDGWQHIQTVTEAQNWLSDRINEGDCLFVQEKNTREWIGFVFLYWIDTSDTDYAIRFGYLLSELYWGKGLGTELVQELVTWCHSQQNIHTLSGGVAQDNIGSIKILEKIGFIPSSSDHQAEDTLFYEYSFKPTK